MTWARSPTCQLAAVRRVDVGADLDDLAGDLVADGARGREVLVAVVEDLDVGAAGGAVADPQLDLVGPAIGLGHVLEPDVLGGVEAQGLHGDAPSFERLGSSRAIDIRVRKKPHLTGIEVLPECLATCPMCAD